MVDKEIVVEKISAIQRYLGRIKEIGRISKEEFLEKIDIQDRILFNLQKAIQASIDMAGHIVVDEEWGVPKTYRDTFQILNQKKVISQEVYNVMGELAGFRNILIHEYNGVDLDKAYEIYSNKMEIINKFLKEIIERFKIEL